MVFADIKFLIFIGKQENNYSIPEFANDVPLMNTADHYSGF